MSCTRPHQGRTRTRWISTVLGLGLLVGPLAASARTEVDVAEWARPLRGGGATEAPAASTPLRVDRLRRMPVPAPDAMLRDETAMPTPQLAGPGWTEQAAVARMLEHHPALEVWRQKVRAAGLLTETASALAMPVLKLGLSDAPKDLAGARRKNTVGVEWTPPQPGERGLRRELADGRHAEARHTLEVTRDRLVAEVRSAHAGLGVLEALVIEAREAQAVRERLLVVARAQWEARRRTQAELMAVELQTSEGAQALAALTLERDTQSARLHHALGETGTVVSAQVAPVTLALDAAEPVIVVETALRDRAELRALAARCAVLSADLALQAQGHQAWFKDVQLSRSVEEGGKPTTWEVQVGIHLPVTGPRNGAPAAMDAQRAACAAELAALGLQVRQELADATQRLAAARRDWRVQHTQVLPLQEEQLRAARAARAAGRLDDSELLGAQLRRIEARMGALRRLQGLRLAEVALAWASGQVLGIATEPAPAR